MVQDPAWRVFAYEFNKSALQVKEDDERSPAFVISPTGAKINRVFVVGVLTQVEQVRSSDELWRARIVDPTGAFTVYAGKYQPEAAAFLAQAEVPQFVAVLGRARLYTRDGTSYASIWSKEINPTTETVRNNWVITTAERTLDRVEALKLALSSGLQSDTLRTKLLDSDVDAVLADGITHAMLSYNGSDVIVDIVPVIASAIEAIAEPREFTPANVDPQCRSPTDGAAVKENERNNQQIDEATTAQEDPAVTEALARNKEHVLFKMNELDVGSGVPYDRLIETLEEQGLGEEDVEEAVQELMDEGKCYEPRIGILKLI